MRCFGTPFARTHRPDLPRLLRQIREAGVNASLAGPAAPSGLPSRVDLFGYRIVQEALTKVLKHAGLRARAEVRIGTDARGIAIEILDDGNGTAMGTTVRGHGIIGMRERALLLGGTLDAGPRPGGGFQVIAHLPTRSEPT